MNVAQWLNAIDLGQYEALFREHEIDANVLPDLVETDLEKIGVPLGHRKRLMRAIAALSAGGTPPSAAKPASAQPSPSPPTSGAEAERRPITVMFCDLVGSTSLAARLDAEDWRNLVNAYLDQASAAVTDFGGHVLKKLGDGLMALFGYPQAQENDAERAVRAALAIQRALADLNARNAQSGAPELSARIGLESGQVVVDPIGEVFGDAPNIAARVQSAAEPDSILITASVQRQTAGLFVVEDRGAHELRGVPAPVALYRIVRASGGGRRGGARILTPLVGREDELALLVRRWSRALEGEGQFVQIVGEPGIGKSRLIEEFRAKLAETPHTWVEWAASQLLQNTPLHPIAEWGRLRFGGADATDEGRLADLENTLGLIGLDAAEYAPLLAPLVDVPLPQDRRAKLPPEELRRRQLAAMTAWVLAGARSQPVVIAFEDLHWADPTSLDLMARLAERGAQSPLLVVATTRPEFRAPWAMRSHHGVVSLAPLDRAQVRKMVSEIASRHALSDETIDGVGERTGGVPLFVEEVTRLLLERDAQGGAQAIPPTLQQSLAARLDRLGEAREVAQTGAVLGRDFSYRLLSDVFSTAAGFDELRLQAALDRLVEADLLFVDGAPPNAAYHFKHALIQDAAYESLLKSRRQALHRRAAEALIAGAAEPEVVAHHFTAAGLDDAAIEWWGKAGDQALRRSAFQEAIAHLGKAIAMADKEATARQMAPSSQRLKLQNVYGHAVRWSKGFAAEETKVAFDRASELAAASDDFSERFFAREGQWTLAQERGELRKARELASNFLREAESDGRVMEAGVAHRSLAFMSFLAGDFLDARLHCEQALATCSLERDREAQDQTGEDTGTVAISMLALTSWHLGEVDRARGLIEAANRRAAEINHVPSMAIPLYLKCLLEIVRGDASAALIASKPLDALSREHGMALLQSRAKLCSSWANGRLHDPKDGAAKFQQTLAAVIASSQTVDTAFFLGLLAQLEAEADGAERALARLDEAFALAGQGESRFYLAFLHRLRGDLLLKRNPEEPSLPERAYQAAIAVAKEQGARSLALLAALPLAKLYQSSGRRADAHTVLAPALDGFSPTPEMPEIAEAQALLATLAESDEVKAAGVERQRRLHLQTAYGQAMMMTKGFAAEETKAAFARASELAAKTDDFSERFAAAHGQWTLALVRGEHRSARELASVFLREAEGLGRFVEVGVASRGLAIISYWLGEFAEARIHCERALAACDPERDREARERFSEDTGLIAMSWLAVTMWQLGEVERARELVEAANRRAAELGHAPSMAHPCQAKVLLEMLRGDAGAALAAAEALQVLARDQGMPFWRDAAERFVVWARGRLHDPAAGAAEVERAIAALGEQGWGGSWFSKTVQAEFEVRTNRLDSALACIDEALALAGRTELRCNFPFPHLLRGEILLKCDPCNPAPAEDAFLTAIAVAKEQGARSWGLRAALALAKLYCATSRTADAHAVLAPALEGFSPTPEMREIAEAQALLAGLAGTDEVKSGAVRRKRLTQLHAAYGNALIAARGHGAPETMEAFARARKSASGDEDTPGRLAADYGLWVGSFVRGDLPSMRTHAAAFLAGVAARPDSPEAGVAHRVLGNTHWFAGEYAEAREHLERALTLFQPGRDDDLAFRFGQDAGVAAMCYLAIATWPLGNVRRAVSLVDGAHERLTSVAHIGTHPYAKLHVAMFELMRGDRARAAENGSETARLAREHDLPLWRAYGAFFEGLATAERGALGEGLSDMRRCAESLRQQDLLNFDGLFKIALAEAEARAGDPDRAIAILDEALATADRLGYRAFEAELHRARGEILLARDPANPAPAEEALLTAIAVAKRQGTRSFELRAALSLAKLYQSTGRPAEAHAVLAPALEGFAPTPEAPEIAEAEALLTFLAETEEVKSDVARRRRDAQLRVAYGNALIPARGYGAPETEAAFAAAREQADGDSTAPERLAADYGLWANSYARADLPSMQAYASAFLDDVRTRPESPEAGVAHRATGLTSWFAGKYREAQYQFERALSLFEPGRDDDLAFRFGPDPGVAAMTDLAIASWPLGEVDRALSLIDRMQTRISCLSNVGTVAFGRMHAAVFELMRSDKARAEANALELSRLGREHGLTMYSAFGLFFEGWVAAASGAIGSGLDDMRRAVALLGKQDVLLYDALLKIALAEAEARAGDPDYGIAILDEALATHDRLGFRAFEAELHRARGDMLLRRDSADPAPAEEALKRAIDVARAQETRSFGLRAALSLAKLYQSTGRPADAHAVLAPALEEWPRSSLLRHSPSYDGRSSERPIGRKAGDGGDRPDDEGLQALTPGLSPMLRQGQHERERGDEASAEMPEVAEAQALLATLSQTDEVKAQIAQQRRLTQLHVARGNALIAARGYGAPETTEAFARARESASGDNETPERLAADFGLWAGSYARGELPSMRAQAAVFLSDVAARPDSPEAGVAHRAAGMTCWFAGEYREAQEHLERALALFHPGRDDDLAFRFGPDPGVAAMAYLAFASWPLGEVDRAISLIERLQTRIADLTHVNTLALGRMLAALFELMRGDHARAAPNAFELTRLAGEHDLPMWRAFGLFLEGWGSAVSSAVGGGLDDMRRGAELLREQNVLVFDGLLKIALAEAEARAGDAARATAILDDELTVCDRTGNRAFEAELHRARGEMLLKRDRANPAPAEEAFRTAIAVATHQSTRSFELRAALALARLYQSTARPADARAVLAPALEGFAQTPEMPEIAEAQALLAG